MTAIRVGIQALTSQGVQAPGHVGTPGAKRRHGPAPAILDHEPDGLQRSQAGRKLRERRLAGDHLEEDQTQGVEVGPLVDILRISRPIRIQGIEMLRRHVRERAAEHGPTGHALRGGRLALGLSGLGGEVEVQEHGRAVSRDQDVGRFQVPVEQSPRVGVVEPLGQSGDDPDRRLDAVGLAKELTGR